MRRLAPGLAMVLIAAAFMVLGAAAPAFAHSDHSAAFSTDAPGRPGGLASSSLETLALSAFPAPPALPWPLLAAALIAGALCWRRPRRTIVLVLVLLLAVLCFEDGLHSVHHLGGHAKPVRCAIAAATAHLTATAVDTVATADVVLPIVAVTIESGHADPVARFLCPDQGRAPPSATA